MHIVQRKPRDASLLFAFLAALAFASSFTAQQGSVVYAQSSQSPRQNPIVSKLLLIYTRCATDIAVSAVSKNDKIFAKKVNSIEENRPYASSKDVLIAMYMAHSYCAYANGRYIIASLAAEKALKIAEDNSTESSLTARYPFTYTLFSKVYDHNHTLAEWIQIFKLSLPSLLKLTDHSQTITAKRDPNGKLVDVLVDEAPVPSVFNDLFADKYKRLKDGATYQIRLTDNKTDAELQEKTKAELRNKIEDEFRPKLNALAHELAKLKTDSETERGSLKKRVDDAEKKRTEAERELEKASQILPEFRAGLGAAFYPLADHWTLEESTPSLTSSECPKGVSCTYDGESPGGNVDEIINLNFSIGRRFREPKWSLEHRTC
jgi:hypothetical protein